MRPDDKIDLFKWIDHWVGVLVCSLLSLWERASGPRDADSPQVVLDPPPKAILIIKFFGLGSILLSAGLVRSIKERYPATRILFLSFKENEEMLKILGLADEIRVVDTRGPLRMACSILANLVYFFRHRPDVAVDLEFFAKFSTLMAYLSGARWRVGFCFNQLWRYPLVNVPVHFNHSRHILEIYSQCGHAIGVDSVPALPPRLRLDGAERESVQLLWSTLGLREDDLVLGVNVNASGLAYCRRWPRQRFAEVIGELLREDPRLKVLLTGTRDEQEYVAGVLPCLGEHTRGRVVDLAGALTLRQFLALLERLDVFLTNDSGPFHMAQIQRTPVVSIWGAGSPDLYGHLGPTSNRVIYKRWACSPCLYIYRTDAGFFCRKRACCLDGIESTEVAAAVRDLLGQRKRGAASL